MDLGRKAFGICLIAIGIQQLVYGDFDPVFLPGAFASSPIYTFLAYPWGIAFTAAGVCILLNKKSYQVSLIMGGVFLLLFLFFQSPYLLFVDQYGNSLGTWTRALKGLAFAGGAFAVAGSYSDENIQLPSSIKWLEKLIPFAGAFFSTTMILFGIEHFLYAQFVATLVPIWIPGGQMFWTYFAGVALIGSGVCITLKIKLKLVAMLLGTMIFLWFIVLHIPRAVADPFGLRGNEMTSVFQSFGFSGVAFVLALLKKKS